MDKIVKILKSKNLMISFAESCTGGLLAAEFVGVSGSSEVFSESVVTYSNEAKVKYLKVSKDTLNEFGAVSKETAYEMAEGIKNLSNADIGVSITGIAGPTGGTINKPVGLVYIGVSFKDTNVYEYNFAGDRLAVRLQTVFEATKLIEEAVR